MNQNKTVVTAKWTLDRN